MSSRARRPLVAGNWKMNGLKSSLVLVDEIAAGYESETAGCELLLCPPATLLHAVVDLLDGTGITAGGQDAHAAASGAHTGDVSAEMLADLGATHVILGHSERRAAHRETDAEVRAKAVAARNAGLVAIVCVGETRAEREEGRATDVVSGQLRGSVPEGSFAEDIVIAYEPVWAIGTGLTPTTADVAEMHSAIRRDLGELIGQDEAARTRILYGGSVKPANAGELMAVENVDGALVGGASLVAADFLGIAATYRAG